VILIFKYIRTHPIIQKLLIMIFKTFLPEIRPVSEKDEKKAVG